MNTAETKPGTKFKHLGGVFTLGMSYPDIDTLYLKDQNDEIYEMRISEFKRKVRDGVYELLETDPDTRSISQQIADDLRNNTFNI